MSLQIYNKVRVIGKGSYGEVWLVKHKKDKKQYVLKKLELQNASKRERKAAEQEAKLLSKLKHPNIVSYKDSFQDDHGFLYIAMGFCEGGDLYGRLKEQKSKPLEERQVVEWFVQIAMALQYMHERNILHRDLKTQNIFLTKSKIIKLGDLGIARVLDSSCDMATTLIGTPYYMSPELFSNKPYNHKSDVWALGCCVYEMATLKHAFNAKDMNSLVYKILRGKMPQMPKIYSPELVQLIKAMLNQNPDRRPSVNRILRDPYIKKNIAIFLEGTKKSRSRPGSASSRRGSDSSRGEDVIDSARSNISNPNAVSKSKQRNLPKVDVLEPLQVGPDLEPIREEDDRPEKDPRRSQDKQSRLKADQLYSNSPNKYDRARSPADSRSGSRSPKPNRKGIPPRPKGHVRTGSDPLYQPNKAESPKVSRRRIVSDNRTPVDSPAGSDDLSANSQESTDQQQQPSSARPRPLKKKKKRLSEPSSAEPEPIAISVESVDEVRSASSTNSARNSIILDSNSKPVLKKVTSEPVLSGRRSSDNGVRYGRSGSEKEDRYQRSVPLPSSSASDPRPSSAGHRAYERESGYGSASSYNASRDDSETPRPNTARARRREKKDLETPRTSRSVDLDRNRRSEDFAVKKSNYRSEDYSSKSSRSQKAQVIDLDSTDGFEVIPQTKESARKDSMKAVSGSVSSSSDEEDQPEETVIEKEKKRKEKEMNNFISLLDTTLKMPNSKDEDDDIRPRGINGATYNVKGPRSKAEMIPVIAVEDTLTEEPFEEPSPSHIPSQEPEFSYPNGTGVLHVPAGRTMTTTGRLWERITVLRKDCIRGLGVEKLKRAYDILDNIENDEVEPRLIQLLGRDDFEFYAGKIWQLKFCEEAAFGLV